MLSGSDTIGIAAMDAARVLVGTVFLVYASYTDLKTRRVNDKVWVMMGALGTLLFISYLIIERLDWVYGLIVFPTWMLFANAFIEPGKVTDLKERTVDRRIWLPLCLLAVLAFAYQVCLLRLDGFFLRTLTMPVIIILAYVFYYLRLLVGGADAKALMAIALLTPFYPQLNTLVGYSFIARVWPFPIVVLTNSVIMALVVPICFLGHNIARRELKFPACLLGYKMDIDKTKTKFVWLMERIEDDKLKTVLFPKSSNDIEAQTKLLSERGIKRVWVTPKIPFIVPLTAGFISAFFIGDVMFKALLRIYGF